MDFKFDKVGNEYNVYHERMLVGKVHYHMYSYWLRAYVGTWQDHHLNEDFDIDKAQDKAKQILSKLMKEGY